MNPGPKKVDCTRHPGVEAAWICTKCRFALCPKCAAGTVIQMRPVVRCTRCGGEAKILATPSRVTPYWKAIPTFVLWMFAPGSLVSLLGIALLCFAISFVPVMGPPFACVAALGYYYLTARNSARGRVRLFWPRHMLDDTLDLLFGAGQFAIAAAPLWLVGAAYAHLRFGWMALADDPAPLLFDPVAVPFGVLGALYLPAALIQAMLGESLLGLLNPVTALRSVASIQRPYLAMAAIWVSLVGGNVYLMLLLVSLANQVPVPVVTPLLLWTVGLLLPLVSAFVLGRFVLQYGALFGVSPGGDFFLADRTLE